MRAALALKIADVVLKALSAPAAEGGGDVRDTHVIEARDRMKALLAQIHIRYVVWRRRPDLPAREMPRQLDGRWDLMTDIPPQTTRPRGWEAHASATAVRTDRYEVREDGEVARVYELHW